MKDSNTAILTTHTFHKVSSASILSVAIGHIPLPFNSARPVSISELLLTQNYFIFGIHPESSEFHHLKMSDSHDIIFKSLDMLSLF